MRKLIDHQVEVRCLGQTGFRFKFDGIVVYIDPYLSNSVQEHEGADLARLQPIPISPSHVRDANWVLVTHEHRDHCDLDTLVPMSAASKSSKFVGPATAVGMLRATGIDPARIIQAECEVPISLGPSIEVHPVPSAHPSVERDSQGASRWLGYVIHFGRRCIYHAGDTSVSAEIVSTLLRFDKIDVAFLPVNEKNYYRERRGIVGNMSVREAFQFADEIGARTVVPTHWDMFEQNAVFREEIELLYRKLAPSFDLLIEPELIE